MNSKKKEVLIIGGGPAGCSVVHQLYEQGGWDITLIDAASFLGAGVRTNFYGGHPYTFGPRHFLTQSEKVFSYLNEKVPLRDCGDHQFITYNEPDNDFYNFPIHMDDVKKMPEANKILNELDNRHGVAESKNFEEYWMNSVGKTLYDKMVNGYTKKIWQVEDNKEIDTFNWSPKGATLKDGPREAWDEAISAYPYAVDGYNSYFDTVLERANVLLNTKIEKFDIENKKISIDGVEKVYDIIVNTISPDTLFDYRYGELSYIGRDFHKIVFPTEYVFPENIYFLYYGGDEKFSRLVEYKKFTHHKSDTTLVGMEIPSANGKYYPIPIKKEMEAAERYFQLMPEGVFSIGRAGSYRYQIDIDDCIEQAMELADILKTGAAGDHHPVVMKKWREFS
jgi:UDP-galactopyranose mutase